MPPRATAKPRATRAKAPVTPEPAVVEEAPEPDEAEEDESGPVSLTTRTRDGAAKPDLAKIFDVDGRAFFLDKAQHAQVILNGMWVARGAKFEPVGAMEFIKAVLGDEALTALRGHPDFDLNILYRVVNTIMDTVKGGSEPGKP